MTGRERLNAILHKRPTDRMPWTTLVDNATLSRCPSELQGNGGIDFYKGLGCDIFLLNGWNTPHRFRSPQLRWPPDVEITQTREGQRTRTEWRTARGTLKALHEKGHPLKYPVDTLEAVRIYHAMWEGASFAAQDDAPALAALDALIGDHGVVTRFWGPSTIPRLLEVDMGTQNFYYLLADHPSDVTALIAIIHAREVDAFRILAAGPCDSVTLVENTSTFYISPAVYRDHNMPHQREFVDIVKAAGKPALLHMCGHVHGVLDLIKETRCDGIHALTPPPTGDTPWADALDVLGEDTVIFGCLDPSVFISGRMDGIAHALDALITPRLRDANFVLCPMADGIPVDLDRFLAIGDWMARNAP